MADCCAASDFDEVFTPEQARKDAAKFRREGLDAEAARIVDAVHRVAGERITVLEVGGGIGAIQVALLRAGATRATNVELSRSYETVARELADEAGVADRLTREVGDFVTQHHRVPEADAVIMQRVVCCYPHAQTLVEAAARHARRVLVLSLPRDTWWMRAGIGLVNVWPRLRGWNFRSYVHATQLVAAAALQTGMRLAEHRRGVLWQMLVLTR